MSPSLAIIHALPPKGRCKSSGASSNGHVPGWSRFRGFKCHALIDFTPTDQSENCAQVGWEGVKSGSPSTVKHAFPWSMPALGAGAGEHAPPMLVNATR
eukprot:scaffold163221_cov31-Tisochrysis_lutea.AAC.1